MVLSLIGIVLMSGNFLDTNIVIYSLGNDSEKRKRSIELISDRPVISVQVFYSSHALRGNSARDAPAFSLAVSRKSLHCI